MADAKHTPAPWRAFKNVEAFVKANEHDEPSELGELGNGDGRLWRARRAVALRRPTFAKAEGNANG